MRVHLMSLIALTVLWPLMLTQCVADHLPENKIARGKSEALLSGIDVNSSTIRDAIKRLGKPTRVIDIPSTSSGGGGTTFEWKINGAILQLGTWNDKGEDSIAYSVEVWGSKSLQGVGRTGRGLKLGDTLADVRRIYGHRFSKSIRPNGTTQIIIQWQDDTTLYLYFSRSGRINNIHLLTSDE